MSAMVHELATAGCLSEPKPPAPQMTTEHAARLLCELSRHVRLSDPDEDHKSLLTSDAMVTFAWNQAVLAGIPPTQQSEAHEARRVLLAHHRAQP